MITLADIFQNGMTLQRGITIPIFGVTDKKQKVEVWLSQEKVAESEIEGTFTIMIPPQEARFDATLEIKGVDNLILEGVDIGEVWLAGGQSNMEFLLQYDFTYRKEKGQVKEDVHLRFYDVPKIAYPEAGKYIQPQFNVWRKLSQDYENTKYFSAAGTYFAEVIRRKYPDVPVAIVGCNWGGTVAATWTKKEDLLKSEQLKYIVEEYEQGLEGIDREALVQKDLRRKEKMNKSGQASKLMDAVLSGDLSPAQKMLVGLVSKLSTGNQTVRISPLSENRPAALYENMLMKIKGFGARGVIWYQGESDEMRAGIYDTSFKTLIHSWRTAWGYELAFLFVQLAPFETWLTTSGANYPELRMKQDIVSKTVPNTYMASIMDSGQRDDIHPKDKKVVGERLALLALNKVYGEDILGEAPEIVEVMHQDNQLVLRFANAGTGLYLKGEQINSLQIVSGQNKLDYSFVVEPEQIVLTGAFAGKEIEIYYAWEPYCEVNLYNSAHLSAKPFFRTCKNVL